MTYEHKEMIRHLRKARMCKDGVRRQPHKYERNAARLIEAQAAEITRLREALGFYANLPCRLEFGVVNECPYDDGDTARAALTQEKQP